MMKKTIVVLLLAVICLTLLVSCGNSVEGEYECMIANVCFSTITLENGQAKNSYRSGRKDSGTYELSGTELVITWDSGSTDRFQYDAETESFCIPDEAGDGILTWVKVK